MKNIETVKAIYESFGRGDVPAILATLGPDVDWDYANAVDDVPWLVRRRGPAAVGGFFEALRDLEFTSFQVKEVFASADGKAVVALCDVAFVVKSTGKTVSETDELHLWRFGDDGKVARFRHGVDTTKHVAALTRAQR
jgi:hypothetical protein